MGENYGKEKRVEILKKGGKGKKKLTLLRFLEGNFQNKKNLSGLTLQ